jgi:hypothetical protein
MLAQHFAPDLHVHGSSFSVSQVREWLEGVLVFISQTLCAMRGHDLLFHVEVHRLSVRCSHCGWESPGWLIDRPRYSYSDDRTVRRASGYLSNVSNVAA